MNPSRLVRAVRVFLDFLYLAQLPRQSSQTLRRLNNALETFHENKTIFVDLSICKNLKIPKVHSLRHYVSSMKLFATTDNYNTQHTECLHSTLTKPGYCTSNARDELPQMTMWLECQEKINQKHKDISQVQQAQGNDTWHYARQLIPSLLPWQQIRTSRSPTVRHIPIEHLISHYGATNFRREFVQFVIQQCYPGM